MEDSVQEALCAVFATCHRSTSDKSVEMLNKLKRKNYVTPTNYLEFVNGYRSLLAEKRKQIGGKATKLRGGMLKLEETGVQAGATLVHFSPQPKPFWSRLPVSPCLIDWGKIMHPTCPTICAYVEPKSGRV